MICFLLYICKALYHGVMIVTQWDQPWNPHDCPDSKVEVRSSKQSPAHQKKIGKWINWLKLLGSSAT